MAKRKTLVKNKRKKRQTKKRLSKKYIGGDINEILKHIDSQLRQQIMGCLDSVDDCPQKKFIVNHINKSNLSDDKKVELINYVTLNSQAELKGADKQLWDDITHLLNIQCGENVETSDLKISDGTNRVNLQSAYQNVMLAREKFEHLKQFLTPHGIKQKEKEFYNLLYNYATKRCNNIKVIRESVLKSCLDYYKKNSLIKFHEIMHRECRRIIYNIDYSSWSGWRDQITDSITRLFVFLNLYKNYLTNDFVNEVKIYLLEKICKIITFKRKKFGRDNDTCDVSVKNNDDYKDFLSLIDQNINTLSTK